MDASQIRTLTLELQAKDVKKQQKALKTLQSLVSKGSTIAPLLPIVLELVEEQALRQDAIQVLAAILALPSAREECSNFSGVVGTLLQILTKCDPRGVVVILSSLEQLLPEDIVQMLRIVDPETLMRRALAQPAATRPMVFKTFGSCLVKCWPCVAAGYDEELPNTCVEALRMAFAVLASESEDLVLASAAVLDQLMSSYLGCVGSMAPMALVAFFHPAWEFRPIYATLLMEVLRDLRLALPRLIMLRDPASDAATLATEAGAFRASLLWFFAFGGGLARNADGGHESMLLVDLGKRSAAPKLVELPAPPEELSSKLRQCSSAAGAAGAAGGWGAAFASARAQLVQMLCLLCYSSDTMQCRNAVLTTCESLLQLGEALRQSLLRYFLAECLSSAIALWHVMGRDLRPGAAMNHRACDICGHALLMGSTLVPQSSASAPRLLQLMVMAAKVFVSRASSAADLDLLPAAARKMGHEKVPPVAVAAICRACWSLKEKNPRSLVEGLVQRHLLTFLLDMVSEDSGKPQASAWLLIAVAKMMGAQPALVDVFNRGELLGKAPAMLLASALLDDGTQNLTQSSRSNMAEVLRQTDLAFSEWSSYRDRVAQALQGPSASGQASTALVASGAANFARWLHLMRDSDGRFMVESPQRISLSGPPVFVYAQPIISWVQSSCHVTLRIDLYNATALSIRDVRVNLSISRQSRMGERPEKTGGWHFLEGLLRPLANTSLESITCRSTASVWRDLYLHFPPKPLSLSLSLSYGKIMPESTLSGLTPASTPMTGAGAEDLWSDEEDEDNSRLRFRCLPISGSLSWYFVPFLGFDCENKVFPPPLIFAACPHSKMHNAKELGIPQNWAIKGFRQIPPSEIGGRARQDCRCFAGIGCDAESLLCFILRPESTLEVRSNNEWLLQAVTADLMFWLLADEQTLDNSSDQKELGDQMDHNEEPLGQVEDARVTRQGRYSAWLKKAKSENARCKLIQSHNTRYFTIDFDSQIIFYSHSTSQKKVSQPIPFRDILGAERLPLPTKCRKSKTAMIFGFILKTKPRTFELFTNSSTDAAQWTFSLNAAMEMGKLKCLEQLKVLQGQQAEVRNQDEGASLVRTAPQTAAVSEDEKEASRLKQERPATEVEQEMAQEAAAARRKQEEEAARQKQEEEAAAKKKQEEEEAAAKRKQEEEEAARKKEEAAAKRKQEEEAAARRKQEEEAAKQKQEEEAAAKRKQEEEEAARKKAWPSSVKCIKSLWVFQRKSERSSSVAILCEEEEAAKQKQEEEAAAKRKQEEEEAARKKEEAAAKRKQEEEAAARRKQEEEAAARKKQEEEALARQTEADAARKEAASPEGEPSIEAVEDLSDVKVGIQDLLQDAFESTTKKGTNEAGVLVEALAIFLAQDVDDAGDASEWKEMMRLEDMQKAKSKKSEGKHEKREKKRQKEEANQANQANQELVPEGRPTEELRKMEVAALKSRRRAFLQR
ncbi:unnamed protein product [Cladocopium goreaui]|uniref:PH domain-containing protein n=1 Tax=Cladocopium goreaui TaxID=2562237 RepID=A0A9P1C0Q2_9DINO|nr:unnamed protein product [Cladocopium goreaui]